MRTGHPLPTTKGTYLTLGTLPHRHGSGSIPSLLLLRQNFEVTTIRYTSIHPSSKPKNSAPKNQRREFSLAKRERIKLPSIYEKEGKEESKQATLVPRKLPTYLPTHERKNFLFLPSVFTARNLDTNVIERKVIFTPPFSSSFCMRRRRRKRRSENRDSRIDYGLGLSHSLTTWISPLYFQVQVYKRNEGRKKELLLLLLLQKCPPSPKEETALLREGLV